MAESALPTVEIQASMDQKLSKHLRIGETIIEGSLLLSGLISIAVTIGIVFVLLRDALQFFALDEVKLVEFFTGTVWQPQILATAIYLSEYASVRARNTIKPILEVLAGIPTVVYGYFALTFMTPFLRSIFGGDTVQIYNVASAGIVVGILIIPLVASLSEDALHAVPGSLRQAAYGLGATKLETSLRVVVPAALSGITAAFVVSISRAVGETMIVAIAAGAGPKLTFNPLEAAETMTGYMVRISGGDLSYDSVDYQSIFAIGLVVFMMTMVLNIFSQRIVRRFREAYE
jgi:phosphate transport system permease protein